MLEVNIMDYCLFSAPCSLLRLKMDKSREGESRYECCCTCPRRKKCEFACKDKEEGRCKYSTNRERVIKFLEMENRPMVVEIKKPEPKKRGRKKKIVSKIQEN